MAVQKVVISARLGKAQQTECEQRVAVERLPTLFGDSGEAERVFRKEAERYSGMIPNTIGA